MERLDGRRPRYAAPSLAEDPLQADYRRWRMSMKYTAKDMTTACVITGLGIFVMTMVLVWVNGGL